MRIVVLALLLPLISCAPHRIAANPPVNPPISGNPVPSVAYSAAWKIAIDRTLSVRPDASQDIIDIAPFVTKVLHLLPDYINPISGQAGFFLNDIPNVPKSALDAANYYPNSVVGGKLLVEGYTDVFSPGTIPVYVIEGADDKLVAHEFLHALWFLLYPGEYCPNTTLNIWSVIDHGFACDPLLGH